MASAPADILAARVARVRKHVAEAGLQALLVSHLPNLSYLTGFRATAGAALVTRDRLLLLADFRYRPAAEAVVAALADRVGAVLQPVPRAFEEAIVDAVRAAGVRRVGVEAAYVPVKRFEWLRSALERPAGPAAGPGTTLVATERLVERERTVKDGFEIGVLREAGRRLSEVARVALGFAREGRSEREVAADIDYAVRRAGFERSAFETTVASGPNSVQPHARPTDRWLRVGDPVVLDFGGVYDGYCVDLTRTVSVGAPTAELVGLHQAVVEAQAAALAAVRPGVLASTVDAAARDALGRQGLAEAFGHATGHGLGLEVHEEPRIGRPVSDQTDTVIEPGMVFTLEPGAYVAQVGGVRIEDDVLVSAHGCELLTNVPRALTLHLA